MLNLILAFVSSVLISIFLRVSESKVKNNYAMFLANYFICSALSALYIMLEGGSDAFRIQTGSGFALGLGALGGILFLVSFVLLRWNISMNGVVLSATFMRLGVLVPTIMAIVAFHEQPGWMQLFGLVAAVVAIIIINGGKSDSKEGSRGKIWLLVLLIMGGFTDSLANIFDKVGQAAVKNQYLFFIFIVATLLCVGILIVQKHRPSKWELLWGALVGIPNYFSTRFMLLALGELPAIVVYPVYNIATILLLSLAGVLIFKEKLNTRKAVGLVFIVVALILLNL